MAPAIPQKRQYKSIAGQRYFDFDAAIKQQETSAPNGLPARVTVSLEGGH